MNDTHAMDEIAKLMSGTEWDSDTTEAIAQIVRLTGRIIADPDDGDPPHGTPERWTVRYLPADQVVPSARWRVRGPDGAAVTIPDREVGEAGAAGAVAQAYGVGKVRVRIERATEADRAAGWDPHYVATVEQTCIERSE